MLLTSSFPNSPIGDNLAHCLMKTCRPFLGNLINEISGLYNFHLGNHKG